MQLRFKLTEVHPSRSDLVVPIIFPGGWSVSSLEGRFLSSESSWKDVLFDVFISAEEAILSLCNISANAKDLVTVPLLISHACGKSRRVSIYNVLGQKSDSTLEDIHTFVPISVVMGIILLNLHKFEVHKKLRFAALASQLMDVAIDAYPKFGHEKIYASDSNRPSRRHSDSEPNSNNEEFEEAQCLKYTENYRTMRHFVPPSIARTDLRSMVADGVPQKIADRVWSKKALWLLCMHPTDIPKVHIADLRGKYDCHGLDIVELGALWHILPRWEGGSPKAEWRRALKSRLDELLAREISGKISANELRDPAYKVHDISLPPS